MKIYKVQLYWSRFYEECRADIWLWCYFILFQQLIRVYFIIALKHYLAPETKSSTILYAMMHGFRFDSLWATCWLFIALAFFTLPSLFIKLPNQVWKALPKYRRYLGGAFTFVTSLIYFVSIEYYREYKDVFNQFLFNWFYEDQAAILKTIYAEHHVILYGILLLVIMLSYVWYSRYFIRSRFVVDKQYSYFINIILFVVIVLFYVIGFRGGFGPRPIQLKDAGVTKDAFLNKAIVSPYSNLRCAINVYRYMNNSNYNAKDLSGREAQDIAMKYFNNNYRYSLLNKYVEKTAKGSKSFQPPPKHIFLIVGESLDAWPLEKKYREFNLTPNLHNVIASGLYFKYFLACAYGTMATLNTIIAGILDTGIHLNFQKSAYTPYPTSLAPQIKKLGFKPQFFYGGYLSWEFLGDFVKRQGFDVAYGASDMSNWRQTNEWGADDRTLFEFIASNIRKANRPTFNVIMTTSNHPPYSINLKQEGFHKDKIAALLAKYPATDTNVRELGHIWYADKAIAEFIKKMTEIDDSSLFIITGDHYGRRHILPNPPYFDTAAVPLIIYSKAIKNYCANHNCKVVTLSTAGSHIDLDATIIELIAPKGFKYYAMGDDLLAKRKFNFGIGMDRIITKDYIASAVGDAIMYFDNNMTPMPCQLDILKERFRQAVGIARYMIKNGSVIHGPVSTH